MDEKPTYQELEKKIHQLEQAIQAGEDKYRILLDESSDPIFSFYPEGTYRFVNKAFAEGVGKSIDEIIGHSIRDIFPGEEGDKIFSVVKDVFATGKPKTIDVRVPRPGSDQFYITTVKAIKDNHGKAISAICSSKNITDRKQTEKTLRENEERHRLFFENAPIGIIHYSNKGIITAVNEAMVTTFGSSREKLIGLDIDNILNKKFAKEVYQSLNGKFGYFEGEYSSYTGSKTSYIRSIWIPIKQKGKILAGVGIVEDITGRKKAEEELRLSQGKLSAMLVSMPDRVSMMDSDLNILWANDTAKKLFGEDLIGKKCYQAYHGKVTPCEPYPCLTLKSFDDEQTHTHDTQVIGKDGQVLNFHCTANVALRDENGNPTAVIEVSRDITEHKQAEEAILHHEELLQLFVKHTPAAVAMCNRQMQYLSYSDRWAQDYGLGMDSLVGCCHYDLFPDLPAHWKKEHQRCFDGEVIRKDVEPFSRKDGSMDWVRRELCPWRHRSGDIGGLIMFTEVITDKKRLEDQLRQSQKMEAIGTLAGGIAHDFNNLLMGIQGRASLILIDLEPFHPHAEHIKAIEDSIRGGAHLTKQLLGFARRGKYEVRPLDINELLLESATMFGRTKKEIHIHTKLHNLPPVVAADRRQIEQVLLNLYINAWQAMPDGGELYLETKLVTLDDAYCKPHQLKPGCYAKVSVTDTGIGMDQSIRQQIFDPFFTTKDKDCGTGLGLASVYGIIKNHAGIITVNSQVGQGTRFNIYLPISKEKVMYREVPTGTGIFSGSETILLVEDEAMIRQVGQALLEKLGYRVIVAKNGKQAVDTIVKKGDEIDLVILDLIMPEMGGDKAFDLIREIQPAMPVILSSGYSLSGQANAIMRRGCNGFIQKPFTISELSQKVRKILDEGKGPRRK